VVSGSWWFAVIAVPLTILTFLVWKWWLGHAIRSQERKQAVAADMEKPKGRTQSWTSNLGMERASGWVIKGVSAMQSRRKGGRLTDNGRQV
jgi:hypothetical protein